MRYLSKNEEILSFIEHLLYILWKKKYIKMDKNNATLSTSIFFLTQGLDTSLSGTLGEKWL